MSWIECVPNFSTSNPEVISKLSNVVATSENAHVLNVEADRDYNRVVFTFVVRPNSVIDVCFNLINTALNYIDMRNHKGEHPRLGAVDVFPLVPLVDVNEKECINYARKIADKVGRKLDIPVYLYGKAALDPNREVLSDIRRGEYESLSQKLQMPKWKPDFGPAEFVPKSGACVIGVRNILIAYNINLDTDDIEIANKIARRIRTSGGTEMIDGQQIQLEGILDGIQAMGVSLTRGNRDFCQVSTNVLNYKTKTAPHEVFEKTIEVGKQFNVEVTGSELVGLAPMEVFTMAGEFYANIDLPENELVELAINSLGLDDLAPFDPDEKIIDYLIEDLESTNKG